MRGKVVLSFGLLAVFMTISVNSITVEEAREIAKIFSEPCRRRYRIPNNIIEGVNKGEFPDNRDLKCYANCMLEMTQTVSRGRINYQVTIRQIDLFFPEEMKESAKKTVNECRGSMKGIKDYCEASYNYIQCMYKVNKKDFFFP
uniref:Proteinral odorant-binding protein 72 n=2 Tax=Nyssomyia neivai TaxID=330878 RepID=A0A1L8DPK2_9DIPT